MIWKTLPKSRYSIKYHSNNGILTFDLAGAHQQNRQLLYRQITEMLALAKQNLLGVTYNVNGNIWQDLEADLFNINLRLIDGVLLFEVTLKENDIVKQLQQLDTNPNLFYNTTVPISLGAIPHESHIAEQIKQIWDNFSDKEKQESLKITGFKFNAWDGDTILVHISMKVIESNIVNELILENQHEQSVTLPSQETVNNTTTLKAGIPPNYELKYPFVYESGGWESVREQIFANVSALFLIKELSSGTINDTSVL